MTETQDEAVSNELEELVEAPASEEKPEEKAEEKTSNFMAGIARGRMAAALVYVVKFNAEGNDSELANKFATTPGKINDIKKDRNFKYVTKDMKFTQAEIDDAKTRFKNNVNADNSTVPNEKRDELVENVHAELDKLEATETSQLETVRKAERKPRGKEPEVLETDKPDTTASAEETAEAEENLDDLLG